MKFVAASNTSSHFFIKIFPIRFKTPILNPFFECGLVKNLENISKNKTTLIIAHRLSTAAYADNIIVLDKGSIIEQGSHNYLLDLKGKYFEMWEKQKA